MGVSGFSVCSLTSCSLNRLLSLFPHLPPTSKSAGSFGWHGSRPPLTTHLLLFPSPHHLPQPLPGTELGLEATPFQLRLRTTPCWAAPVHGFNCRGDKKKKKDVGMRGHVNTQCWFLMSLSRPLFPALRQFRMKKGGKKYEATFLIQFLSTGCNN